jgi:phosphoribosylaminoimidazole (AIR) synthetase
MGVGWVVIVDKPDEDKAMGLMPGALRLGEVQSGNLTVKTV